MKCGEVGSLRSGHGREFMEVGVASLQSRPRNMGSGISRSRNGHEFMEVGVASLRSRPRNMGSGISRSRNGHEFMEVGVASLQSWPRNIQELAHKKLDEFVIKMTSLIHKIPYFKMV
jgi:hypothetical protein